jgi:hypothetical protein
MDTKPDSSISARITIGGDASGQIAVGSQNTQSQVTEQPADAALAELLKQFQAISQRIETLPAAPDVKEDLKTNTQRIEVEVKKGDKADPSKVERWLVNIGAMSDDIFQVMVATLTNPVLGVVRAIQLIGVKAKEEKTKLDAKK